MYLKYMSCSICLSEPPNEPVNTIDGSIYCLQCISIWFDSGKDTSPTTGMRVLKLLVPATMLCQQLNIPVTKIPEKYTQNALSVAPARPILNTIPRPTVNHIARLPIFLQEAFHPFRNNYILPDIVNDILKLYEISRRYLNCTNEEIYNDKIKFFTKTFYSSLNHENSTYENGGHYKLTILDPLLCLPLKSFLKKFTFKSFKPDLTCRFYNLTNTEYRLFRLIFLENIPLELLIHQDIIKFGFDMIFERAKEKKWSKFYVKRLNSFEIRKLLELHFVLIPESANDKKDLMEILSNSNIQPDVNDFYQIYI